MVGLNWPKLACLARKTWHSRLDACSTGDQEVGSLIPAKSAHSLVENDHELFSKVILSLPLIQGQWGWSGCAKVLCILRHQGVQLILVYSWARPVILVAGKGRGGMFYFFCFFTSIPVPLSSMSLSLFISSIFSSISFLPFSGRRHKMIHKGWCVVKPQHKQSRSAVVSILLKNVHNTG